MKKIAIFLVCILCVSLLASVASAAEMLKAEYEVLDKAPERTEGVDSYSLIETGGFELDADGGKALYGWTWTSHITRANTFLGCGFIDRVQEDTHEGEYAVRIYPAAEGEYCNIAIQSPVIAGQTYEIGVWSKRQTDGGNIQAQIQYYGKNKGVEVSYYRTTVNMNNFGAKDGWVQTYIRFVAPEFCTIATLTLKANGPCDVLFDDVTFLCISNEMPKPEMADKLPALVSVDIPDPSFEEAAVGTPVWELPGWEKQTFGRTVVSDKYAHTGTKSLELHNDGVKDSIAVMYLNGLEEGTTYQISSWLMNPTDLSSDLGYWVYFCSAPEYTADPAAALGQVKPRWQIKNSFGWMEYVGEFEVPQGARSCQIYFRNRATPCTVYMDDVEIYMVKTPPAMHVESDEIFYYTEWKTGKISLEARYLIGDPKGARADFVITNEKGATVYSGSVSDFSVPKTFEFPTSVMQVKGERHNINMKVYGADGALQQEENFPVFRYDRPTYLGADGIFRKNGQEIPYAMGSGLNMQRLELNPQNGGITIAQLIADSPNLGLELRERMDAFYEKGIYVILNLYAGTISAGHETQIDSTRLIVESAKDHPALFGWKIIDEPYQKRISEEEMIMAYKTVRDIDPNHPVYTDDSPKGSYSWLFKFCDVFDCDYYTGSPYNQTTVMEEVQAASKGRKPYNILLQFFQQQGYFPSFDELRHMTYQALFAGAYGYSYHTLGIDGTDGNKLSGMEKPQWQETVEKWAPWERDFAFGCFVTGEYKFVNYQKTEEYIWGTFTDGTDLYAITLNRSKDVSCHVDVPLSDGAGILKIDAFTAVAMAGKTGTVTGNGTLSLDLAPWEASVWKITPSEAVDFSVLKNSKFNDVIYYPWAYNAIATLEEKGIVNKVSNEWYGPGQNITRGDYAMFLVRTLGLTDGAGENFVDVDANAEYAKELAIGKAAGIINGVGDNKFNPTAQITRQDMMTMTSRALKLAGAADLSAFADSGIIADYAQSHVAAMVAEGLIKGNADGTINPLGNTTRAEAAVIMQRLLNK
ncbi:MAG: S-layer homology domain-containing protein [Clostridia bacterium]|nr:S-layer homology domain-containing protein [Clostridia bacterium]